MSARRLQGAHLPVAFLERRGAVAGECLGYRTPFAIDVRMPLPATCPACGVDVLAARTLRVRPGQAARVRHGRTGPWCCSRFVRGSPTVIAAAVQIGNGKYKRDPCGHVKRDPPGDGSRRGNRSRLRTVTTPAAGSFSASIGALLLP